MLSESLIFQTVALIKQTPLTFLVMEPGGHVIAELHPIGSAFIPDEPIIVKMNKWRNRAKIYFKSQFDATIERTKIWLSEVVVPSCDRILFMIYVDGLPVGHFGLCNINSESAELDNAIRGEFGGGSNLFEVVERALIEIAFNELAVKEVTAKVFSNNVLALRMHTDIGFAELARYPLKVVQSSCMREYIECTSGEANVKFSYVLLSVNRSQYFNHNFFSSYLTQ
jgi:RimJ/RimL family protein N-acetyltransferase